ncbi:MAG: tRNA uridine(34) 5-carboxymethylaminomethyl modification radical SAM/GNAT enzyme Elp3 [Anaerolineaceae bacterium]|jgi:elongator complex protein 3|nr:tRNA uridine(34) 5-carboxymethylaminomethyl modification radical SAM/GNAT enzyme Elp3 [Anaerolineaceae bacterium]
MDRYEKWTKRYQVTPDRLELARKILTEIRKGKNVIKAVSMHPIPSGGYIPKSILVAEYKRQVEAGEAQADPSLVERIRTKPVRSLSGVTTVTVLTKPYPCPGKCIFCPDDVRMPKSYLIDEPGAARAFQHDFDPYWQVKSRLDSYEANGHPTDKIELLILGGTWSAYRRDYQEHFIKRCFDAMNDVDSQTLTEAHRINETAAHRNVGLVIETRPDEITPQELAWLRKLGVTKVQMGVQSLDDRVLELNQRGHTVADALRATALLRAASFKIVLHWMPNLLGATLQSDKADFSRLWSDGFAPDEIKIYPTQLLEGTELFNRWQNGEYEPYTQDDLVHLIADVKPMIQPYCRVNRVIRDIPSHHVVEGNKRTSLRQDVLAEVARRGQKCNCIRCNEVKKQKIQGEDLRMEDHIYHPAYAEEHFIHFRTPEGKIAGYLRLSLPQDTANQHPSADLNFSDLHNAALVREVHVYGQSLAVGAEKEGAAQHIGLGKQLLEEASRIALEKGYTRLAVIAAIGTRQYYQSRGFERGELYMLKPLG